MQTLSYGFYKPGTGDKGSSFFPRLEDNFQLLNDHTHNGSNSAQLTTASMLPTTAAIVSGGWVSQGAGTYRQTVTVPAGLTYDSYSIDFRNSANGHRLYLTVEKVTSTTYYVYINDNTIDLTAVYT